MPMPIQATDEGILPFEKYSPSHILLHVARMQASQVYSIDQYGCSLMLVT